MRFLRLLSTILILSFFLTIFIPVTNFNLGFVSQLQASDEADDPDDDNHESESVSEPSLILLVGAGIAGVVAYRKIKNRNKTDL